VQFRYIRYNRRWKRETESDSLSFIEAQLLFLVEMRVQFRHGLRLVRHPEIVDVFQTKGAAQSRLSETFEAVPAHSLLIQSHLDEPGS
jgi:hypothetical protein